jgi:hypothetical protein
MYVALAVALGLATPGPGITEMKRIHLILFDMNNRKFAPYLAAVNRILISPRPRKSRYVVHKNMIGIQLLRRESYHASGTQATLRAEERKLHASTAGGVASISTKSENHPAKNKALETGQDHTKALRSPLLLMLQPKRGLQR